MKKINILLTLFLISFLGFSQAKEDGDSDFQKIYEIVILKDGEVKHVVKQGAQISVEIDGKTVNGRWYFESYPDRVKVITKKGVEAGVVELNKQSPLRIVTPQPKGGMSVGIGVGPVSVSNMGPGYQSFNMEKYTAEISERDETKEEKLRREYYEKKEQERLAKEAAKQAKKDAKKNKKK
ncbi:MAG: hypothetical protein P1U41_05525 [Vicingaceae bacterium]|nr:hypothetical protein [Vicingaceae bacterium]